MPLLSPIGLHEVLRESGIVKSDPKAIRDILDSKGLSLSDAVDGLKDLALSGNEGVKLKATEMTLKLHGALEGNESKGAIAIQFSFPNGDNSGLMNVLIPRG